MQNHKTGYHVWVGGDKYWHQKQERAIARATAPGNWYARDITQVIEVATGALIWGRPQ